MKAIDARSADLYGKLSISGGLEVLKLGRVIGGRIDIGRASSDRAPARVRALTASLDAVNDALLTSQVPIRRLGVAQWHNTDAIPDRIVVPAIERLLVAGDWEADVVLGEAGRFMPGRLFASVGGDLLNAECSIHGDIGRIAVAGRTDGWRLEAPNRLEQMQLGIVHHATVTVGTHLDGEIGTLRAMQWDSGSIEAGSIRTLMVTGNRRKRSAGNFGADLRLTAASGQASLGRLSVAGWLEARVEVAGPIGLVSVGAMRHSVVAAGVRDDGSGTSGEGMIKRLVVRGIPRSLTAHFVDSRISAYRIGTVRLAQVATDNGGSRHGIVAHEIGSYRRGKNTMRLVTGLADIAHDFVARTVTGPDFVFDDLL